MVCSPVVAPAAPSLCGLRPLVKAELFKRTINTLYFDQTCLCFLFTIFLLLFYIIEISFNC